MSPFRKVFTMLDGESSSMILNFWSVYLVRSTVDYSLPWFCRRLTGLSSHPIAWDTIEDHFSFASSPRFSALESAVKPAVTDWPPRLFHVHFKQGLPSLDIPFAELILLKRQPATASLLDSETLQQSLESFVKIASSQQQGLRTHFYGTMHEDSETFVVLFVWESLEVRLLRRLFLNFGNTG